MLPFLYRLRNFLTVDSGGMESHCRQATIRTALAAAAVAAGKIIVHGKDGRFTFDFSLFAIILGAVVLANIFQ